MIKTTNPDRESGFTLLELLLVIGVAALLLIGGIATYRLVSDGNKTTESIRMLLTLRQETQTMAQQQGGTYTDINFDSTQSNTSSPLVVSGTLRDKQNNPFNGAIVVTPATNAVAGDSIDIEFDNLSQSGCSKLAMAINNPNEILKVTVNATAVTSFPLTAALAAQYCNKTDATNKIIWQFP